MTIARQDLTFAIGVAASVRHFDRDSARHAISHSRFSNA
jgi:hypothetical protein